MAGFIEVHPNGMNSTVLVNIDEIRWVQPFAQGVTLYYRDGQNLVVKDNYVMVKTLILGAASKGIALA